MTEATGLAASIGIVINPVREFVKSFLDHRKQITTTRNDILEKLSKLEHFDKVKEDQQEQLTREVIDIIETIKKWERSSNLHNEKEKHIFQIIRKHLVELKDELKAEGPWETKKPKLKKLLLCCILLENRYGYIHNGHTDKLPEPLHEDDSQEQTASLLYKNPSFLYYTLPFLSVFFFLPILKSRLHPGTPTQPNTEAKNLCPLETAQPSFKEELKVRVMGDYDDESFKKILPEKDLQKISKENNQNLSKSQKLSALLEDIKSYQAKVGKNDELRNKLDNILPLLHIFHNNARIDEQQASGGNSVDKFQIAVAVPFGSEQTKGPLPWGLGVLRGVDMAQKLILDKNRPDKKKAVLLRAVIVNDTFAGKGSENKALPQHLAHYLSTETHDDKELIGMIGHQQSKIANLTEKCYDKYKFPALIASIHDYSKEGIVQSLLPTSLQMSEGIIKGMKDAPPEIKDNNVVIFFDLSSKDLMEKLCAEIDQSRHYKSCIRQDVSNSNIGDHSIFQHEWIILMNPFEGVNGINENMRKINEIVNLYRTKLNESKQISNGRIFIGHNFVDEIQIKEVDNILKKSNSSKRITIWRFSPWDWRSYNSKPSKKFKDYAMKYGYQYNEKLNWYTINSINSMLIAYTILDDENIDRADLSTANMRIKIKKKLLTGGNLYPTLSIDTGSSICRVSMTNEKEPSTCY